MGTVCNIGWKDKTEDAEYSGGLWSTPLNNLKDPRPGIIARSTNAVLTSTKFFLDLGSVQDFQMLVAAATNLTEDALWKFTWYSDAFVTAVGNTGWLGIPGYPAYDYDNRGVDICFIFDELMQYRYALFEMNDTANPEGQVDMGRFALYEIWEPTFNFSGGSADDLVPKTSTTEADGGTEYHRRRQPKRLHRCTWPALEREFVEDDIRELRSYCGTDRQVFFVPNPDDTTRYNYRNFLGRLTDLPGVGYMPVTLMSTGFTVQETV